MAAAEGGATALYCNMERPASGSAVNMLRSRRRNSAGRRRSGEVDRAIPSAAMAMEGGATLGSQVVANARRELASAYLPPSGMQSAVPLHGAPPRQIHSAASGSSWGAINAERKRLMDLVLERLVELRFGGALPAGGTRSISPLGQEDEVVEFLDVVLGRLNLVPGERPPPSRSSSRGKGGSPKSRRIAAAAAAAAAGAARDGDEADDSAAARANSALQDPAARIVELQAELGRWKRECQQQRTQKQKLAAERVALADRLADVQFALKQHEHQEGLDRGLDSGHVVGQHGDEDARGQLAAVSQQLKEAQQFIRQLQQQNQQLQRESKAAAATDNNPRSIANEDEGDDSSIEDLEMEQLLSAARDARRAAEISQEGRLHEQSLTQHLAAARIQRRYREQTGRRVLREVRQAAASTVQLAWARPATAPGGPIGRPITPEHRTGQHIDVGQAATATDERVPAAAACDQIRMGGLPNADQQAKIDADMAWLASMGMPVSQIEYATGNRE